MVRQKSRWWKRTYRVSLTDDKAHHTLRSYRSTGLWFAIMGVTAVVVVLFVIYSLIAFTPIRTIIPGYPDAYSKKAAITNAIKIDSLENMMLRWELYAENLSRVLNGESPVGIDSLVAGRSIKLLSDKSMDELRGRDSLLREMIREEEQFRISEVTRIVPLEGMLFFTPLKGVVSRGYDIALHPAIDVVAPKNSTVCATLDGSIISAEWSEDSGYSIWMQHEGDVISVYKHCQKVLRKVSDKVKAGTPIALTGGSATLGSDDHLHFELWYRGETVDPSKYLGF